MFLHDGNKILYRAGYAILKIFEKDIFQIKEPDRLMSFFLSKPAMLETEKYDLFVKIMCRVHLKRKEIILMDEKNREKISVSNLINNGSFYYRPKIKDRSSIITKVQQWETIWSWIPPKFLIRDLRLVFTTKRDGYSISTFYNKCKNIGPNLLLIECVSTGFQKKAAPQKTAGVTRVDILDHPLALDPLALDAIQRMQTREQQKNLTSDSSGKLVSACCCRFLLKKKNYNNNQHRAITKLTNGLFANSQIIGAFSSEGYRITNEFYGTSDTFLFSITPREARFRATEKNPLILCGKADSLTFGGGGDGPGLHIDSELLHGSSKRSDTFMNEPLCYFSETFDIMAVEVYTSAKQNF